MKCKISEFRDGALLLDLEDVENIPKKVDTMEYSLVFASGCMRGDPGLEIQRAMLEELVKAWDCYCKSNNQCPDNP